MKFHWGVESVFAIYDLIAQINDPRLRERAGGEHFARLEINQTAMVKKLLPITSNPQLDALFAAAAS